jgi:hypothetical protein
MGDVKQRLGRMVRCLLLSAAACLMSGAALAVCSLPEGVTPEPGDGNVLCYIRVQPIDVCFSQAVTPPGAPPVYNGCGPFNTLPGAPNPTTAGFDSANMFNNSASLNPIGFVINPATGLSPGQTGYSALGAVDVTRALLNNVGVELVWLRMVPSVSSNPNFTTLSVVPKATTNPPTAVATGCTGSISNITLTITGACQTGSLALYNALSGGTIRAGTVISAFITGSGGAGTYKVSISQTVAKTTITASATALSSQQFLTLSQQDTTVTTPLAISKGGTPVAPLGGGGNPLLTPPIPPLLTPVDPTVVNMFFVQKLNPPLNSGILYGFAWLCNNGVAIGGDTFSPTAPLLARTDTITHELLHTLCLDHMTYGAGPYNLQSASNPFPPGGITPPFPAKPLTLECDSGYPACAANLMTAGNLRTAPMAVQPVANGPISYCVLAGFMGQVPPACVTGGSGTSLTYFPSLYNGLADQVTPLPYPNWPPGTNTQAPTSAQLPVTQQQEVLGPSPGGGSGLLFSNNPPIIPPLIQLSGLVNPIPYETTKAQLGTGGSSTDRAIFDLSGPLAGKPGETLVAWVLTLPEEQTFAGHGRFDIVSQSRKDLVQSVNFYPDPGNNPLMRNIAYQPGDNNNADNPSIGAAGPSPCVSATAECLIVKFQPPGVEAHDRISFSTRVLSGAAPITNDDLCKAKITYIFSDGFATTSNLGRCPAASLPLVASSWRPDPHVAPQIIKSNVLLVDTIPPTCPGTPPDPAHPDQCSDPGASAPSDSDASTEGGQLISCDNGVTFGTGTGSGLIKGPVGGLTISAGQRCTYPAPGHDCEIVGNMTINGGTVTLNCQLDGNLTVNSGQITLGEGAHVLGNVQISQSAGSTIANGFNIGTNTTNPVGIDGNLTVQGLVGPPTLLGGSVCHTVVKGNVTVQNNISQSPIEIGDPDPNQNCPGISVGGSLVCKNNQPVKPTSLLIKGKNQCSS